MLEKIIQLLKNSGADDWEVTDTRTEGWEFYYIRHDLDQNRAKKVEHINVTVYKKIEDGKYMGRASAEVAPTESEDSARQLIEDLVYRASLVRNNPYPLHQPAEAKPLPLTAGTLEKISADFIKTMQEMPETAAEDINSYEIFVSEITRRLITSQGIDVTENYPESMLEVVANARSENHEIELYRMYHSGTCDQAGLKKDISAVLRYGRDRLHTVPTPGLGKCPVVFSTSDAKNIYDYFLAGLNAQLVFRKMSSMKIDTPISNEVTGDKVTIQALRQLPNSSKNFAYDSEGAPIKDLILMEADTPKAYWGDRMFASYLGLTDSFMISNYEVTGGTKSEAEIRTGRYLEIVEFSDFQVSEITGDIFGEIRLGYYHDGDQVTAVSGGSVSGSMREYLSRMVMSKEQTQYNNVKIPSLTKLMDVTVAGAENK